MPTSRELDHQYRMRRLQVISVGWERLMHFLCVLAPCICVYFGIRELAGRQTFADISFKVISDLKANRWMALSVPWGVASIATVWGAGERYLRKRHIRRVSSEESEMQKMLDPSRRSSSLSKRGETSPEDY
jgi:hypothetical protein